MGVSSCVRHHHPIMHTCAAVIAVIGFACNTANSYDGEFGHGVGNGGATGGLGDAQDYSTHVAFEDHSNTVSDISLGDSLVTVDGWRHKRSPHHHKRSPHRHKRSPHHHKRSPHHHKRSLHHH